MWQTGSPSVRNVSDGLFTAIVFSNGYDGDLPPLVVENRHMPRYGASIAICRATAAPCCFAALSSLHTMPRQ